MKTMLTDKLATVAALSLMLGLFTAVPASLKAEESGSAKGGATTLMFLNSRNPAFPAVATSAKIMSCAACKDTVVTIPDTEFKGAGARALVSRGVPTKTVAKHLCNACRNEWVVKGHGKAKTDTPVHRCATCG